MVRILNFFCVALMGLSILALYHVSERARVAHMELVRTERGIAKQRSAIDVLETEWQHVASPGRIQQLAEARLGMSDMASVQLSSFEQLPRRGEALTASPVRNASARIAAGHPAPAAIPISATGPDSGM
jgi:hypothetical protein